MSEAERHVDFFDTSALVNMIKAIPQDIWLRYKQLLPTAHELYVPALPKTLPSLGVIEGPFDYVPPEALLERLRQWLERRGVASVFYFLTESLSEAAPTDYELSIAELTEATLSQLNKGFENVLVGTDFSWGLFMDHEGKLHVAGPEELFACWHAWSKIEVREGQP
jgi:hypothetical protein